MVSPPRAGYWLKVAARACGAEARLQGTERSGEVAMPSLKKGSKKKKAEEEKQAAAAKAKEEKQAAAAKAAEAKEEVRPPYTNNPKVPRALGSPALRSAPAIWPAAPATKR